MATLSDVAKRAGVSISAVSRVLSDAPNTRVSIETRKRIREAARALEYRPNYAARALKFSRTNAIGVVVPDVNNALFSELMRGIDEEAGRHGYMMLMARAEGMPNIEETVPRLIGEGRVDGVLLQLVDDMRPESLSNLFDKNLPIILVNTVHPEYPGSVTVEDALAMGMATQHLLALGHTRIGFIGGPPESDSTRRREGGFRTAMSEAGIAVDERYITRLGYFPRQGAKAMAALGALPQRPTAVIAANVNAALGTLLEARRLGLRVPEDLSIVAMHETWTAESASPPLTTVRMPLANLGRLAFTDLIERIRSDTAIDRVVTDPSPELVVRESTAPPPLA